MKPLFFSFILITFLSCQSAVQRDLKYAESLLHQYPDSALICLKFIEGAQLHTKQDEAKYALLMSAALDKNYIDVSNDSLINKAVEYYSQNGDTKHKMLAYYYQGVVLKNGGRYSSAIIAFEKAEKEAMIANDAYQLGLIYRNMAALFGVFRNTHEAILCNKKSVSCFKEAHAFLYQTYAELSLAIDYINNGDYSRADSLLLVLSETSNVPSIVSNSNLRKAFVLINKETDFEDAVAIYHKTPIKYYDVLDYAYLAVALEAVGQKDSADSWMSRGYARSHSRADTAALDYMRSKIALRRGQYKDAYLLVDKSVSVQDSLTRVLLQQSVNAAQRDYYKAETARQEDQLKATRRERTMGLVIGFLILIACALSFWAYAKEKDRLLQEQIARLSIAKNDFDRLNKENAHLLGSLLSSRISHLDQLTTTYFKTEDKKEKEEVFKQIKQSISSLRNSPEVFLSLEQDLDEYCNGIVSKLRKQVPRIKGGNISIIILFFAGFSYDVVQLLTGSVSVESLKMARSRFRKEIIAAKAPDKDFFLRMLDMKKRPQNSTNES